MGAAAGTGAGEGNRTLVVSLEGFCSTIELHPPSALPPLARSCCLLGNSGGEGWIRTNVGARPTDLQSAPFNHSGTPPGNSRLSTKSGVSGKQNRRFPTGSRGWLGSRRDPPWRAAGRTALQVFTSGPVPDPCRRRRLIAGRRLRSPDRC